MTEQRKIGRPRLQSWPCTMRTLLSTPLSQWSAIVKKHRGRARCGPLPLISVNPVLSMKLYREKSIACYQILSRASATYAAESPFPFAALSLLTLPISTLKSSLSTWPKLFSLSLSCIPINVLLQQGHAGCFNSQEKMQSRWKKWSQLSDHPISSPFSNSLKQITHWLPSQLFSSSPSVSFVSEIWFCALSRVDMSKEMVYGVEIQNESNRARTNRRNRSLQLHRKSDSP